MMRDEVLRAIKDASDHLKVEGRNGEKLTSERAFHW
jgi:hypothetical protein